MPKSRIRKKDKPAPEPKPASLGPSAPWVAPLMLGLFLFGLIWIVVYYVSNGDYPIGSLDNYNLLVGFGFITGGFITSTQWR
ncbi:cell division protein CrgA [Sporichthya polymorpha]|uniref:cell division protein CrgA n=1 Tax=Sporichthya polymorpha TaxID=35751 RepID=UPI000381F168|nr:cell division protein CrgA [Sporichthya polymorpha]